MPKRYDPSGFTFKAWDTVVRELQAQRDRYIASGQFLSANQVNAVIAQLREIWQE